MMYDTIVSFFGSLMLFGGSLSGYVVHYPLGWMGTAATTNGIKWTATRYSNGQPAIVINGRLYNGIASTPLCKHVGATIYGDFYNRRTNSWDKETYYTGDVSNEIHRRDQLSGKRFVEVDYRAQYWRGYTLTQGYGAGLVKGLVIKCPK